MRSKPDPVDQPERNVHYNCAMYIAEMLHNTITQRHAVLLIFPFLQTNITVQTRPSWDGGITVRTTVTAFCVDVKLSGSLSRGLCFYCACFVLAAHTYR